MKRTVALLLCLFTLFTTVQMSAFAVPTTTVLTQAASAPARVKNVKASAGSSSVTINWSKVSGKVTYVVYEYNQSTKKFTKKGSTTATKYTVKNLKSSKTYSFAVRAYTKSGSKTLWGKMSAVVSVKTIKAAAVAKVSGLKITTSGKSKQLKLSWKSQSGVTGFQVYRSTSGKSGSYKKIASLKSRQLSYVDSGLKNSTPYYYAVRAYKKTSNGNIFGEFAKIDLSTRPTVSYLKNRVTKANEIYLSYCIGFDIHKYFVKSDRIRVKRDGYYETFYRVKHKNFSTMKEFKAFLNQWFDEKLYIGWTDYSYMERNGKLYASENAGSVGDRGFDRYRLTDISISDKTCTLTFVCWLSCDGPEEYNWTDKATLHYRNGNWIYTDKAYINFGTIKWVD